MKDCDTCRHTDVGEFDEPCRTCNYLPGIKSYSNWEPPAAASCENCGTLSGAHAIWCRENAKSGAYVEQLVQDNTAKPDAHSHPLFAVFMAAIDQAMHGKGERHGGARTPFLEQPWLHYAKMHGRGFLTGQAAKKLEEAASTREGKAFETEVFGAMVYLGMAILHERSK